MITLTLRKWGFLGSNENGTSRVQEQLVFPIKVDCQVYKLENHKLYQVVLEVKAFTVVLLHRSGAFKLPFLREIDFVYILIKACYQDTIKII